MDIQFFITTILLGVGLAMDAFSVSLADGFKEPNMSTKKSFLISTTFGVFQGIMPLIGWVLVHTIVEQFKIFEHFIPWIALGLLSFIGIKMIVEYHKSKKESLDKTQQTLTFKMILLQGVATSIDAMSAGFTIANYSFVSALIAVVIIAVITMVLCMLASIFGKKFGESFSNHAELIGGIILIAIGVEIFVTGMISLYA